MEKIKSERDNVGMKTESGVNNEFDDYADDMEMDDDDTATICQENRNDDIDDFNQDQFCDQEINDNLDDMEQALFADMMETKFGITSCQTDQAQHYVEPESAPSDAPTSDIPILEFKSEDTFDILYKTRLEKKVKAARENVQKFSETVKYQYQPFMRVIDNNEKINNGFFCEFLPPRQCPIEKSLSGKWRLKLIKDIERKDVNDNSPLTPGNSRVVYSIKRTNEFIKDEEDTESDLPPYISLFIRFFQDFLNNNSEVQLEASRDDNVPKTERKEFYELHLRSNFKFEIMAIVHGYKYVTPRMQDELKTWSLYASDRVKLASMYLKIMGNNRKKFFTDHVYGDREMNEYIGHIKFNISPSMNFYSNVAGVELFYETLVELMEPRQYNTILMIGSGFGLIPLLLSKDTQKVVGIEEKNMLRDALYVQRANDIRNVEFVEFENKEKVDKQLNHIREKNFFVIVDNNTNCGRSPLLLEKIHNMLSLKYIVVLSTFKMTHAKSLVKFFEPIDSENGFPFYPIKGCIVDPTPASGHFQVVVVLKRYPITKFTQDRRTGAWISKKPINRSQTPLDVVTKESNRGSLSRLPESDSPFDNLTSTNTFNQLNQKRSSQQIGDKVYDIVKREVVSEDSNNSEKERFNSRYERNDTERHMDVHPSQSRKDEDIQRPQNAQGNVKIEPSSSNSANPDLRRMSGESAPHSSFLGSCKILREYLDRMKSLTREENKSSKMKSSVMTKMEKYVDMAYVQLNLLANGLSRMEPEEPADLEEEQTENRSQVNNSKKRKTSIFHE